MRLTTSEALVHRQGLCAARDKREVLVMGFGRLGRGGRARLAMASRNCSATLLNLVKFRITFIMRGRVVAAI